MFAVVRLGLGLIGCGSRQAVKSGTSALFDRWLREEDGQDLIEYALLCSAIGFAGTVAFSFVSDAMNSTYASWDDAVQDDALVEVPCPASDEPPC